MKVGRSAGIEIGKLYIDQRWETEGLEMEQLGSEV